MLGDSAQDLGASPSPRDLGGGGANEPHPSAQASDSAGARPTVVLPQGEQSRADGLVQPVLPQGDTSAGQRSDPLDESREPSVAQSQAIGEAAGMQPGLASLPEWLARLATESWQAELLISGFAIVSTFQLVGMITPLIEWAIFNLRAELLDYVRWAIYYAGLGVVALPAVFVAHFALRTYWVGLVGLSSVYPHGFGKNFGMIPEWVVADTAARHPPLATQIDRIDRRSSVMFAIGALSAMVFISVAIVVMATVLVAVLIERLTGGGVSFRLVFKALLALMLVTYAVSVVMLSLKRYHDRPGFRAVYLRLNRGFSRVMYTLFAQPASYLSMLLTTNATSRTAIGPILLGAAVFMGAVAYQTTQPLTIYLMIPERITEDALRTDFRESDRYRDEWTEGGAPTLLASIPTETLDSGTATVPIFFPLTGDDEHRMETRYPPGEQPDSISDDAWRQLRRAAYLRRAERYFRVRVNDGSPLRVQELVRMEPAGQRHGLLLTVELPSTLAPGRHTLYLDRRASTEASDTSWVPRAAIPMRVEVNGSANE